MYKAFGLKLITLAALAWLASMAQAWAANDACPASGEEMAAVGSIEPRLNVLLEDGRRLRLVGLDPAAQTPTNPDLADVARASLSKLVIGAKATIQVVSNKADRWGRFPAYIFTTSGPAANKAGGVVGAAIEAGLGRYLAEPAAHVCRTELTDLEAKARDGKLGLWRDPYYAVLSVDDRNAFLERSATIVLAEGRLLAVLPGPYRTKLRFSPRDEASYGGQTLSATILPRTMKKFEAQKVKFDALIGQRLRLRGLLDLRFGPQIELTSPDEVEILPTAGAAEPSPAN